MDIPHPKKPPRYLGRHRHPFLTRTVFAALATATVLGTGLTAASAAPPADDTPAAAQAPASQQPEPPPETESPSPGDEESGSEEPKATKKPEVGEPEKQKPSWVVPSGDGISDTFGPRAWRGGEMHNGLDFAAEQGDENFAAAKGTVVQAGSNGGYGLSITIDHGNGVQTLYAHHSQLSVDVGDTVAAGEVIGLAGSTGDITGPHLHFEVHVDGQPVDPATYLEDKGVDL